MKEVLHQQSKSHALTDHANVDLSKHGGKVGAHLFDHYRLPAHSQAAPHTAIKPDHAVKTSHPGKRDHTTRPEHIATPNHAQKSHQFFKPEHAPAEHQTHPSQGKPPPHEPAHDASVIKPVTVNPLPLQQSAGEVLEINNLKHHAAAHKTADAVVRIPPNFDATKPIHLAIYNHGWRDTVSTSYRNAQLEDAMKNALPNTILVMPEWQLKAGAESTKDGMFSNKGQFQGMLNEIFQNVPALQNNSTKDIDTVDIFSHSAGYDPTEAELYQNDIGKKVMSVSMLDSLYDSYGLDRWIQNNIKDIASGEKQFNNIYWGTSKYSVPLDKRIGDMLTKQHLAANRFKDTDRKDGQQILDSKTFQDYSVITKYSNATTDNLDEHMSLPNIYLPIIESSITARRTPTP